MYIDTHSHESMLKFICRYLHVNFNDLSEFFMKAYSKCSKENYCDGTILNNEINNFIQVHLPNEQIDQILFFHLSRRLNSTDGIYIGNNLYDLLTSENDLSAFLKNHSVYFQHKDMHLELYYNYKFISLEDTFETGVCYLRSRLGYNVGREDFCYNGFAFKDLLYKNNYARELFHGPEFIGQLSSFLKQPSILNDYVCNSKYYCFEYCAPLDAVLFDGNDRLTNKEKSTYLLNCVINRLYEYSVTEKRYMYDHDNPVLRLKDTATMAQEYFIKSEEITSEMLRNS